MMGRTHFLWVTHNDLDSLREVGLVLKSFEPDVICLELSESTLKRLLASKYRDSSEMCVAYEYAMRARKRVYFLETEQDKCQLLREISFFRIFLLLFQFVLFNLKNLILLRPPKKLKMSPNNWLWKNIVTERDKIMAKRIKSIISNHKGKRILFIIGKAHKMGILRRLECY